MNIALRHRNFCKIHMVDRHELSRAKGKFMLALRQYFIREAIDSGDGNYKSVAAILGVNDKLVRAEFYAPLYLNDKQFKLEVVRHKILVCNHNHQVASKKLNSASSEVIHARSDLFEALVREVNHWGNRIEELSTMRRNLMNGDPQHGHVKETIEEYKLPSNIHPIN